MGQHIDEFRSVLERCSPVTMQEIVPLMYRVLTPSICPESDADQINTFATAKGSLNTGDPGITLDHVVTVTIRFVDQGMHEGFIVMSLLSLIDDTLKWLSDRPQREKQRDIMQRTIRALEPSATSHGYDNETEHTIRILEDSIESFDERLEIVQAAYLEWQTIVLPYLSKLRFHRGWFGHATCRIV